MFAPVVDEDQMAFEGLKFIGGHNHTVLSIAVTSASNARIISGAENGELAVWTPDGLNLHKICIGEGDVTSALCSYLYPEIFYASCGNKIYGYDLRQMNMPLCEFDSKDEEINQIVLNKDETYLGSANDSGNINIFNLTAKKIHTVLKKHSNICSSIGFFPNQSWSLVSGAYDSTLIQWDFKKSRSFCIINLEEFGALLEDLDSYIVSPSFVHSLAISCMGNYLACGTENGLVHVFDSSRRTLHFKKTLRHHTQGVSQVHFPKFSGDQYVVSGGNDGRICLWDLNQELSHGVALANGCSGDDQANATQSIHNPNFEICHDEKVNWLTTCDINGSKYLAIADNSSCPLLYKLPL